jgi:hypothetical protein
MGMMSSSDTSTTSPSDVTQAAAAAGNLARLQEADCPLSLDPRHAEVPFCGVSSASERAFGVSICAVRRGAHKQRHEH